MGFPFISHHFKFVFIGSVTMFTMAETCQTSKLELYCFNLTTAT